MKACVTYEFRLKEDETVLTAADFVIYILMIPIPVTLIRRMDEIAKYVSETL